MVTLLGRKPETFEFSSIKQQSRQNCSIRIEPSQYPYNRITSHLLRGNRSLKHKQQCTHLAILIVKLVMLAGIVRLNYVLFSNSICKLL